MDGSVCKCKRVGEKIEIALFNRGAAKTLRIQNTSLRLRASAVKDTEEVETKTNHGI